MSDDKKPQEKPAAKPAAKPEEAFNYQEKSLGVLGASATTMAITASARVLVMMGNVSVRGWLLEQDSANVIVGLDNAKRVSVSPDAVHVITIEKDR